MNSSDQENEEGNNNDEESDLTVEEFLFNIKHNTKSLLADRMKCKFMSRTSVEKGTPVSSYNHVNNGTNAAYTPKHQKVSAFANHASKEGSQTSSFKPLHQSCSKMFRSVSTPEMNTKFLPSSYSHTKSNVHRGANFSCLSFNKKPNDPFSETPEARSRIENTQKENLLLYSRITNNDLPVLKKLEDGTKSTSISNLFSKPKDSTDSLTIFKNSKLASKLTSQEDGICSTSYRNHIDLSNNRELTDQSIIKNKDQCNNKKHIDLSNIENKNQSNSRKHTDQSNIENKYQFKNGNHIDQSNNRKLIDQSNFKNKGQSNIGNHLDQASNREHRDREVVKPPLSSHPPNPRQPKTIKTSGLNSQATSVVPQAATPPSVKLGHSDMITVNGKSYFNLRKLGKGGSSIVYEVVDMQTRERRAIKIVRLDEEDEPMRCSYKNEIRLLERLKSSRRIIKLYEHEETASRLKLVMEPGEIDLSRILADVRSKSASLSAFTIKHYWQEMLLDVQVIHQEGIIHSDLKPANFLLVNGKLKLIDFGIASSVQQDMTSVFKDSQCGTYNYMSPESLNDIYSGPIINGKVENKATIKISVKSDVWSLGCILYNLVYGKTPFQHLVKPLQKLAAISNPNTTITFPLVTDTNLLDVMRKCLQFDPYKRPSIDVLLRHPYLDGSLTPGICSKSSKEGVSGN